ARNPNRFLPTVQVGITLVSALAAAYGGQQLVANLSDKIADLPYPFFQRHANRIALAIFVMGFSYVSLIVGELVPKRLSLSRAEGLAIFVAPVMHFVSAVARPFVSILGISTDAVLRLLRLNANIETKVSLDDIEHLIDTGTVEGVVEPLEKKLALGA